MTENAFDARNREDFNKITEALTSALARISQDNSLKATVAELSRISGVHRNTIYKREWPTETLNSIKDDRLLRKLASAEKKKKRQDPVSVLQDKLEKSRQEVVYWFNKFRDSEQSAIALDNRLSRMRQSRDGYVSLAEERIAIIKSLEMDAEKLREVIQILELENAENSK